LENFNGHNFHTWKVKIQLQMMNKTLWGLVNGTGKEPSDPAQLRLWQKREKKKKSIIGLSLSDS